MHSKAPSHGPIRTQNSNRAACRDVTSPYPSLSVRATPQTPLRAIPTRSGVSNTAIQGELSARTIRSKTPCSMPSLSHNSTPPVSPAPTTPVNITRPIPAPALAPTRPTPFLEDFGPTADLLPGCKNLGELTLGKDMDLDHAWWDGSHADDTPAGPSSISGEQASSANWERTAPWLLLDIQLPAAPTCGEYSIHAANEIKRIMDAKKKQGEAGHKIKGIRSITGYTELEQSCFFIMRAVMLYIWITKIPWAIHDTEVLDLAKAYVAEHTQLDVTAIATPDFVKTLCSGTSRLRGEGQRLILPLVKEYWSIAQQDIPQIQYLQEQDRFTYLDHNKEVVECFNTELVGDVLVTLMFRTAKKIGILFLHKMMQEDDPAEINRVLCIAAKSGLNGPEIATIVDTSPEARRGPSISAIAFTCIHIYHALERLKEPDGQKQQKGRSTAEFGAQLATRWAHHIRDLAQHPNLGKVRRSLLQRLQEEYIKVCPREECELPLGNDHLW